MTRRQQRPASLVTVVLVAGFFVLLALLIALRLLPPQAFGIYAVASALLFVLYAWDKRAAQAGTWRTREDTLHLVALLGGWPGALVAQTALRHKTRKQPFRAIFFATVVVNCAVLAWIAFSLAQR